MDNNFRHLCKYLLELACVAKFDVIPATIKFPDGTYLDWRTAILEPKSIDTCALVHLSLIRSVCEVFGKDALPDLSQGEDGKNQLDYTTFKIDVNQDGAITDFTIANEQSIPDVIESILKIQAVFVSGKLEHALSSRVRYIKDEDCLDISPLLRDLEILLARDEALLYIGTEHNMTFSSELFYTDPVRGTLILNKTRLAAAIIEADAIPENPEMQKYF